jgi:hypothetical protein
MRWFITVIEPYSLQSSRKERTRMFSTWEGLTFSFGSEAIQHLRKRCISLILKACTSPSLGGTGARLMVYSTFPPPPQYWSGFSSELQIFHLHQTSLSCMDRTIQTSRPGSPYWKKTDTLSPPGPQLPTRDPPANTCHKGLQGQPLLPHPAAFK